MTSTSRLETWRGRPVPQAPGTSLAPSFGRDGAVHHDDLWWEHEGNRAIRVGDWKLVAAGKNGPWELFDLANDRTETHNLAQGAAGESPGACRSLAAATRTSSSHWPDADMERRSADVRASR